MKKREVETIPEKKQPSLVESFNCAIDGFIYVMKKQRNMRIHFLMAILIFILAITLNFTRLELICLGMAICMVLFAEMINTAVEYTIDMIEESFHPLARIIKDICAGAVLMTSIFAALAGYLLFSRIVRMSFQEGVGRLVGSSLHTTVTGLIIVLLLVIITKLLFHKGTPMRGGMPSGHSAIAFSLWTIIIFSTTNPVIIAISFIMALLIARSRMVSAIHSIWEVVAGAGLGIFSTAVVLQLFSLIGK